MSLHWASLTDVGRHRDHNEDSVWPGAGTGTTDRRLVAGVADGMGGHAGGEIASRTAIEAATGMGGSALVRVQAANLAVIDTAGRQSRLAGMGTTLTLAIIAEDGTADIAHVGDSRAYRVHDGRLEQITTDHSYVAAMVEAGKLTPEEASVHPYRSVLIRAIGLEPGVDVDTHQVILEPGDRLILCSDGLTSMLDDAAVAKILAGHDDPAAAVAALIEAANLAGGADNISVVIVDRG
ncbi:MAG TPA: protein phosphatase 2C domain-containing protein [Acidimicrobiia bacterium]|nr:protein phosphatase 2C domain-containing protein [Acidimicrobiia bacterium]